MVCLGNMCMDTLHKGDNDDDNDDDHNNNNSNKIPQSVLRQVHSPLPKPVLHTVRSSVSYFNFQYPLFSLRSSSSCLRFLGLPVLSTYPYNFPSKTCYRRQFLCKMWPIQLVFLRYISCKKRKEEDSKVFLKLYMWKVSQTQLVGIKKVYSNPYQTTCFGPIMTIIRFDRIS